MVILATLCPLKSQNVSNVFNVHHEKNKFITFPQLPREFSRNIKTKFSY